MHVGTGLKEQLGSCLTAEISLPRQPKAGPNVDLGLERREEESVTSGQCS